MEANKTTPGRLEGFLEKVSNKLEGSLGDCAKVTVIAALTALFGENAVRGRYDKIIDTIVNVDLSNIYNQNLEEYLAKFGIAAGLFAGYTGRFKASALVLLATVLPELHDYFVVSGDLSENLIGAAEKASVYGVTLLTGLMAKGVAVGGRYVGRGCKKAAKGIAKAYMDELKKVDRKNAAKRTAKARAGIEAKVDAPQVKPSVKDAAESTSVVAPRPKAKGIEYAAASGAQQEASAKDAAESTSVVAPRPKAKDPISPSLDRSTATSIYGIEFGRNLRIGQVDIKTGKLIGNVSEQPIEHITTDEELSDLVSSAIPAGSMVGICTEQDFDAKKLIIKSSSDSGIKGGITFGRDLKKRRGCSIVMTDYTRAHAQAESMFGQGKDKESVLTAVYSLGYGCAVIKDGKIMVMSEFGHQPYIPQLTNVPSGLTELWSKLECSCKGTGHLETYVSENGAAEMAKKFFSAYPGSHPILRFSLKKYNERTGEKYSLGDISKDAAVRKIAIDSITAENVYGVFEEAPNEKPQNLIREVQMRATADSIRLMGSAYSPLDIMIMAGSQTKGLRGNILFLPATEMYAEEASKRGPKIVRTKLPESGIQGAAANYLSQQRERLR